MCTAITYSAKSFYFGRNLDLEYSYHETVTFVPRNFPLPFKRLPTLGHHHAIIGMAYVQDNYPLFYDAVNEKGLCMAGLNFPDNAHYYPEREDCDNVAPFELIPYLLSSCATLAEARKALSRINLADIHFTEDLSLTPLHWILSDKTGSIVLEPLKDGLRIHENPVGVLTNNPPFDMQMTMLCDYMALRPEAPQNTWGKNLPLSPYSRGMGALGLPGDWSSPSRFARAAFVKCNCPQGETEEKSVVEFFHILGSVAMPRGSIVHNGKHEITVYSCCCNADSGVYYYTTYQNSRICAVDMKAEDAEGTQLVCYDLIQDAQIYMQNNGRL